MASRTNKPLPWQHYYWKHVNKTAGCWEWQGTLNKDGYGRFGGTRLDRAYIELKENLAHRISYAIMYGLIPYGSKVRHICDNPKCVNPLHLELGSQADNVADREKRGRGKRAKGENNGKAKLTCFDVWKIRSLWESGIWTQPELAELFGVKVLNIGRIIRRVIWKSV